MAAFSQAARSWRDHPTRSLEAQLDQAMEDLAELTSSKASARRREKAASPKRLQSGRARSSAAR
jgi:hypothetical protein